MDKALRKVEEEFDIKSQSEINKQLKKISANLEKLEDKKNELIKKIEDKLEEYNGL